MSVPIDSLYWYATFKSELLIYFLLAVTSLPMKSSYSSPMTLKT